MTERPESVPYYQAVNAALDAVMVVDNAYAVVLIESGIHEDDVSAIQQSVRDLIAVALDND